LAARCAAEFAARWASASLTKREPTPVHLSISVLHPGCRHGSDSSERLGQLIAPLNPLPCPITVAWAEKDALLPMAEYARALPERLPEAAFSVLAGVGHEPMLDDAELVARTILAVTGAAQE
jgi:pimeloyl-ACP methyl ester carboxylesterase